jgi:hypothetical protein
MSRLKTIPPLYPAEAFPLMAQRAGWEIHQQLGASSPQIFMSIINAMMIPCQDIFNVRLPYTRPKVAPTTIWTHTIAKTCDLKSTTDELIAAPIYAYDLACNVMREDTKKALEADHSIWKAVKSALLQQIKAAVKVGEPIDQLEATYKEHMSGEPKLGPRRSIMEKDVSAVAIMEALEGTGRSIAIMTSEGRRLWEGTLMHHSELLNDGFDGAQMNYARAHQNRKIAIGPRLGINVQTQPEIFYEFVKLEGTNKRTIGHFGRYFHAYPESSMGWRFLKDIEPEDDQSLELFHKRIEELLLERDRRINEGITAKIILEFDDDATVLWRQMFNDIEGNLLHGGEFHDIQDFAARMPEHIGRLAAVMHAFRDNGSRIDARTVENAWRIVYWHADQYKRIFTDLFREDEKTVNARELLGYLQDQSWQQRTLRLLKNDVRQNGPPCIRSGEKLKRTLKVLQDEGYIFVMGRPCYIHLNPEHFKLPQLPSYVRMI